MVAENAATTKHASLKKVEALSEQETIKAEAGHRRVTMGALSVPQKMLDRLSRQVAMTENYAGD